MNKLRHSIIHRHKKHHKKGRGPFDIPAMEREEPHCVGSYLDSKTGQVVNSCKKSAGRRKHHRKHRKGGTFAAMPLHY